MDNEIEIYKGQIVNLTRQVRIAEDRIEEMDKERAYNNKRVQDVMRDNIDKIRGLEREKDTMIVDLQDQAEHLKE